MRPVLSPRTKTELDRNHHEPVTILMERAGRAVAREALRLGVGYGSRVSVVVGPGNNGGDGYVAGRLLHRRGVAVSIHPIAAPRTEAAITAATAAVSAGVRIDHGGQIGGRDSDLVIDAGFGGQYRGDDIDPLSWADPGTPVLAVDVPTGLDPATGEVSGRCLPADVTVTFHTLAPGHLLGEGPSVCGRVVVASIGLIGGKADLEVVEDTDLVLPPRPRHAHKWSAGSVLVVGGDDGMIGAAVMAGKAALHFGAGSVGVATTRPDLCQTIAPELLAYYIDDLPDRFDVVCLGPGLVNPRHDLVGHAGPMVLDAGALDSGLDLGTRTAPTVLTPHAGEFARLGGAEATGIDGLVTIVEKGNPTIIRGSGPSGIIPKVVVTGGPELATIGTGDVLSGMISALLSRGVPGPQAAWTAAHIHGLAGDRLSKTTTVTAPGLTTEIGRYAWVGAGSWSSGLSGWAK